MQTPAGTAGRPGPRRDFQRQKKRKPPRCQRTSVSGLKITAASSREGNNRYSQTKISLSVLLNPTGAGTSASPDEIFGTHKCPTVRLQLLEGRAKPVSDAV